MPSRHYNTRSKKRNSELLNLPSKEEIIKDDSSSDEESEYEENDQNEYDEESEYETESSEESEEYTEESEEEEYIKKSKKRKCNNIDISDFNTKEDDIDIHGNIKGLIDYDDEDEEKIDNPNEINPYSVIFQILQSINQDEQNEDDEQENQNPQSNSSCSHQPKKQTKQDELTKKINESNISEEIKKQLIDKLNTAELDSKQLAWFNSLLKIPFGKYSPLPIDIKKDDVNKYFTDIMNILDTSVYGMKDAKEEVINFIAQCLTTPSPSPRIIALHGTAGTGKTKLVREGIAKMLNRPLQTFSMGGIKDSQHFVGFDYTYLGSKYGQVTQSLINSGVMNPVFFMDELDKISGNDEGDEIENLLIHMTDPIQNFDFKDKYFDGVPIDLSKIIFIFAFNDINNINPVLRDRLHIIHIKPPTEKEKLIIAKEYILNELLKNIGLEKVDFNITDEAFLYMIKNYSKNDGLRNLKRCIETILLKINTIKLIGKSVTDIKLSFSMKDYSFPIKIDENNVGLFLKTHEVQEEPLKHPQMYI
jgi:ATP-dependent Lon protease